MLDLKNVGYCTLKQKRDLLAFVNGKIFKLEDTIRFEEGFWKGCGTLNTEVKRKQYSIIQKGLDKLICELAELKSHKADLEARISYSEYCRI